MTMFNWFGTHRDYLMTPPIPPIPWTVGGNPNTHESIYSIGTTTEGMHMTLKMGDSTLTMSKKGCQNLIEQLEVFKNQLKE